MREMWHSLAIEDFDMKTMTQFYTSAVEVIAAIEEIYENLLSRTERTETGETGEETKVKVMVETQQKKELGVVSEPLFSNNKLKFTYEYSVTWETESSEEEEEERKNQDTKTVTMRISVQVFKMPTGKHHAIDFKLLGYRFDEGDFTERENYEVRETFISHFFEMAFQPNVKDFNDTSASEASAI